jgi:hypothetical protein
MGIMYLTPQDTNPSSGAADGNLPDAGAPEVTDGMIEAGVTELWPDPKPPAFIGNLVRRIYLAMERARQSERRTGVSARRQ